MLSTEQINDLHRLYWSERWPIPKIAQHLRMGGNTIRKYLSAPAQQIQSASVQQRRVLGAVHSGGGAASRYGDRPRRRLPKKKPLNAH